MIGLGEGKQSCLNLNDRPSENMIRLLSDGIRMP